MTELQSVATLEPGQPALPREAGRMTHRPGCTGTPVLDRVTAVGPRQWLVFRCNVCRAVQVRPTPVDERP
jgi:hypothetical protein